MLAYPSAIDLSSSTLRFLSGLLAAQRRERGTRWRRLSADRQALLVLAHLRCGHTYAQLAARRRDHDRLPVRGRGRRGPGRQRTRLAAASRTAARRAFVILDGALLPIDHIAADRPYYSGKHRTHGMNVQVIADPFGRLLWASPALPGAVHDIKAARTHGIIDALTDAGIPCWADKGYQGAGGTVRVPYRGRWHDLSAGQQAVNRSHAKIRALGEQAMATLKTWRLLRKLRCSTSRITDLIKAVLTLHLAPA